MNTAATDRDTENSQASKRDSSSKKDSLKRMTVSLPPESARMLEILSEEQSITLNEAVRRSISTESFIQNEISKGGKVLIVAKDGSTKELVFR